MASAEPKYWSSFRGDRGTEQLAADGDPNTSYRFQEQMRNLSWWRMDLGESMDIRGVNVTLPMGGMAIKDFECERM